MVVEIIQVSRHTFLVDLDDVTASVVHLLGYVMHKNNRDIIRVALESALIDLKEKHLKKES